MLIYNSASVGYQCCVCGKTDVHTMELFEYGRKKNIVLLCPKCHSEVFKAERLQKGGYNVDIGCPVCFTPHRYTMSAAQLWGSEVLALKCAYENSETLLIGREKRVREMLDEVFEPFEPFEPSNYFLDEDELGFDGNEEEMDQALINNFLKYLRMMSGDGDGEYLSVEDVLDSSYIPDEDMTVIRFIIDICRLIEDDEVECACGKCMASADVDTSIEGNTLSVICTHCGRSLDFDLSPSSIEENSDIEFLYIE